MPLICFPPALFVLFTPSSQSLLSFCFSFIYLIFFHYLFFIGFFFFLCFFTFIWSVFAFLFVFLSAPFHFLYISLPFSLPSCLTLSCTVHSSVRDVAVGMFNVVSSEFMLFFESDFQYRHSHMQIWELFEQTDSEYESAKVGAVYWTCEDCLPCSICMSVTYIKILVAHFRENFGTNSDHARNSLTNCGIRQPEYGDRRIHYMNTRKRGEASCWRGQQLVGRETCDFPWFNL